MCPGSTGSRTAVCRSRARRHAKCPGDAGALSLSARKEPTGWTAASVILKGCPAMRVAKITWDEYDGNQEVHEEEDAGERRRDDEPQDPPRLHLAHGARERRPECDEGVGA